MTYMIQSKCGDNITGVHLTTMLEEASDCTTVYCERCKKRAYIRRGDKKLMEVWFKRDTLQPHENLYYKEYPHKMNVYHG